MTSPIRPTFVGLALAMAALPLAGAADAADLPFRPSPPLLDGAGAAGGGGFRVARVPLRPAPLRYDIYGYPLLVPVPNPVAVGNGCPVALQPDFDPDGNLAGYAPLLVCR